MRLPHILFLSLIFVLSTAIVPGGCTTKQAPPPPSKETKLESEIRPAPWCYSVEPKPLPQGWQSHVAAQGLEVDYMNGKVQIRKGSRYYTYGGKVAIGWHGTYDPPCGM